MRGTLTTTFSSLFADTVQSHGMNFAFMHYVRKNKMPAWEFSFWVNSTTVKV